ncbi:MAG TPA: hypothetical protein VGC56_07295 [Allosphingosinicella sp.]|jgi:hypothetical protein
MKSLVFAALLLGGSSVAAQDAGSTSAADQLAQETAKLNAQAARDTAAAAATTAATARLKAQADALGLPTAEGKTSLGTNAGVVEAWMLSSSTLDSAAQWIAEDLTKVQGNSRSSPQGTHPAPRDPNLPPPPPSLPAGHSTSSYGSNRHPILLVPVDEVLALDVSDDIALQIADTKKLIDKAQPQYCSTGRTGDTGTSGGAIPLAAIGAAVSLLKTDTEISGVDIPVAHRMLVASTGRRLVDAGYNVILPAASIATPQRSPLAEAWADLVSARTSAKACRERFAKEKKTPWLTKKLAAFDAALAAGDALEAKLLKRDDKGQTPLAEAVRADALLQGNPWVLRVAVEKGGGSILKRSNIWTALGAPAVGITGALIISYTLTDPRGGDLLQSGTLVCRTALTNMRDIQNARVRRQARREADICTPSVLE